MRILFFIYNLVESVAICETAICETAELLLYFSREHSSLTNPPTASGIAFIYNL